MIDFQLNRKDHTIHLKVDTLLTVKAAKDLMKTLRNALKMLEK
jgi:hypothetical protein